MRFSLGHRRSHPTPATPDAHPYQYSFHHADAEVTITAWQCPVQAPQGAPATWFERNCTLPLENVNFRMADGGVSESIPAVAASAHAGTIGEIQIAASPAPGYATQPYMMCDIAVPDRPATDLHHGSAPVVRCNWYTWQLAPGEITVYAWECPEGYDYAADHADPMADCIGIANGAHFRLQNHQPDHELLSHAGAYRMGAARFGDLEPGEYTLSEITACDGEPDTILWQCFEIDHPTSQPSQSGTGPDISLALSGGEQIMCHRFHIPRRVETVSR